MVAAELARLQEREQFLERELKTAQRSTSPSAIALDEELVTKLLGEEAARILHTAREAASQIKVRAEDDAARLIREATDEAHRLREEIDLDAARRRLDANADAEAELEMAKQQGREMVNEARAYRERVLVELARRRELARQQIEQLVHGRDRLLQVFERARLVSMEVVADLAPLGEPEEYVNLATTTGPVPLMVPNERQVGGEPSEGVESRSEPQSHEVSDGDAPDSSLDGSVDDPEPSPVMELFEDRPQDRTDQQEEVAAAIDEPTAPMPRPTPDDLFARLRAARADTVALRARRSAAEAAEAAGPAEVADPAEAVNAADGDASAFIRREELLAPLVASAARKLKRVQADEQNDALHVLRGKAPVKSVEQLVGGTDDHSRRYATAIQAELAAAAAGGVSSMAVRGDAVHRSVSEPIRLAADLLAAELVSPLRDRLARAVADADGDNGELASMIRAIYREWKTQRIDESLHDVARTAFGHGALLGTEPGTLLRWIVDPEGPECPDAEDNSLAGSVAAGEPFPTDDRCAPAHSGCRCMIVRFDHV